MNDCNQYNLNKLKYPKIKRQLNSRRQEIENSCEWLLRIKVLVKICCLYCVNEKSLTDSGLRPALGSSLGRESNGPDMGAEGTFMRESVGVSKSVTKICQGIYITYSVSYPP